MRVQIVEFVVGILFVLFELDFCLWLTYLDVFCDQFFSFNFLDLPINVNLLRNLRRIRLLIFYFIRLLHGLPFFKALPEVIQTLILPLPLLLLLLIRTRRLALLHLSLVDRVVGLVVVGVLILSRVLEIEHFILLGETLQQFLIRNTLLTLFTLDRLISLST